ncbi:MAG: isocitrate lyase/phosphoenolpyruvate mutase family protein [Tabrizicola sp.]|uniref:isocitrate lyase/PEP mutase family protein n=1 Tax=Tabrizicola sp. TaxID=2005166 RepID=UPI00273251F8|nr:isocitrate lyase/phosphoenolpyruvate mutase family protein [Tabrizicola sp.]MDP3264512.1 isocitrate lyase/phosphoenolpyruvate mutase family protein [Tabrizicola sp.]MDP3649508.1 isocitrate lyase/phosphoenolpyruvate mutase family protein [Paracoccaceae bacterium]MDZ4069254.1 isocitrate lyase/phosphoenolpyruvate mutase family protein [Tabrizicola sp.]
MTLAARHQVFHNLHQTGCFVIPNPWDRGSARMMAALGAQALATSSAAHAFTLGRPDLGTVTRDEALAHAADLLSATPLPVSGDFENGFGDDPGCVAETVRLAGEIGLSGICIEDTEMTAGTPPYDFALAVERIRAGAAAARALGRPFIFCARADGVMHGSYALAEGIRRLQAFEAAGADLLYLPVPPGKADLAQILAAVTRPVNALAAGPLKSLTVAELAGMGVRRISTGSQIARLTHAAIRDSVSAMLGQGSFARLGAAASGTEIDELLTCGSNAS